MPARCSTRREMNGPKALKLLPAPSRARCMGSSSGENLSTCLFFSCSKISLWLARRAARPGEALGFAGGCRERVAPIVRRRRATSSQSQAHYRESLSGSAPCCWGASSASRASFEGVAACPVHQQSGLRPARRRPTLSAPWPRCAAGTRRCSSPAPRGGSSPV